MYIFKYMQGDNTIYRNGNYIGTYEEFMADNPNFPLAEGEYFEYGQEKFVRINEHGHDIVAGGAKYQPLINAINNLGE